jgi:hypothetical protein
VTASLGFDRRLLTAALLLIAGAAITLMLHRAGAAEALLGYLYDRLPASLDLPPDPSSTATGIVSAVSLYGGIAELAAGIALLGVHLSRARG